MTLGHRLALQGFESPHHERSDDGDDDLSPSNGYFRGRDSVPDAVFVPDPSVSQFNGSTSDKANEAAREAQPPRSYVSGSSSPDGHRHRTVYTPTTTHTPRSSSEGDTGRARSSSPMYPRYRDDDSVSVSSPPLEEPPPQYAEAMAGRPPHPTIAQQEAPSQGSNNVREPISSLRTSGPSGSALLQSKADGRRQPITVVHDQYDEESQLAASRRPKRRGCCGRCPSCSGNRKRRECRSKWRPVLKWVFGVLLVLLLISVIGRMEQMKKVRTRAWTPLTLLAFIASSGISFGCLFRAKRWLRPFCQSSHDASHIRPTRPNPDPEYDDLPGFMRRIVVRESSNSVSGTYPLYDLLDISTTSGSISITIEPKPGNTTAELRLSTVSGTINVNLARGAWVIPRRYDTRAETTSGSINGNLIHGGGGTTSVSTTSGSLDLDIYPIGVGPEDADSTLHTSTTSGSTNLRVRAPFEGGRMTSLMAGHRCVGSGSLNVAYPSEWEGRVHAKSLGSGSVQVRGWGLQFERKGSKDVVAWKGDVSEYAKTVNVGSLGSGSVQFQC